MKLQITEVTNTEIEIQLPKFWKKKDEYKIIGVIDEKNVIKFQHNPDNTYATISHLELWLATSEVKEAYNSWEEITEEEFLKEHQRFLSGLSLVPVEVKGTIDDLKEINI